ncbi:MAG: hypothetical protein ACOYOA_12010 [Saprospiraceae bacterium]
MLSHQLALTHEMTSPLFRIMWIYNIQQPNRRFFENNICAFHIGNGNILSVAHNLRTEAQLIKTIDDRLYATEIFPFLNPSQAAFFEQCYPIDAVTQLRYLAQLNPTDVQSIIQLLRQINFDTRWITLIQKKICKPYLIIQFKGDKFFDQPELNQLFPEGNFFREPALNRHTFLVELELQQAFYAEDIALYKIVRTPAEIVDAIPFIDMDFSILSDTQEHYYCLQSSPGSEVGKLLNKASIEGYSDHFNIFPDRIGGNYTFEGTRYLIRGYFRFGSSGAPYVYFNQNEQKFKANAIQSEASPIQLSINNNREGNFQYVNALASPLNIIKDRIGQLVG